MAPWRSKKLLAVGGAAALGVACVFAVPPAALPWLLSGLFASVSIFVCAQAYADARTDGKTSSLVRQPFTPDEAMVRENIKAGVIEYLSRQAASGNPVPGAAPPPE